MLIESLDYICTKIYLQTWLHEARVYNMHLSVWDDGIRKIACKQYNTAADKWIWQTLMEIGNHSSSSLLYKLSVHFLYNERGSQLISQSIFDSFDNNNCMQHPLKVRSNIVNVLIRYYTYVILSFVLPSRPDWPCTTEKSSRGFHQSCKVDKKRAWDVGLLVTACL